jgi:hypothetical protein
VAGVGLAACSGSSGSPPGPSPATPTSEPVTTTLTARSAQAFLDSVGVDVHLGYGDTAYADLSGVLARLQELGVKHVRDAMPLQPTQRLLQGLRALPSVGVTADITIAQSPRSTTRLPTPAQALASLDRLDPGVRRAIDAVEVPNEWDLQGGDSWAAQIAGFTRDFGTVLRRDPAWRDVTYVGPSTGRVDRVTQLPDLGSGPGHIDVTNLHVYSAGGPPERYLQYLAEAKKVAPGKPLWVTETGYHTAVNQPGRQPAVTEAQQGGYLTRQLLENFASGVARSYVYELAEEKPNPDQTDQEQHFGLLRPDLTPKPAFSELKALLDAVRRPAAAKASASRDELSLGIETPQDPVGSLLLRRDDGSYRLVLWARGELNHDGTTTAPHARVNLVFRDGPRQVSVIRVTKGSLDGGSSGDTTRITGRLGGGPVVVDIAATRSKNGGSGPLSFDAAGPAPRADAYRQPGASRTPDRVKTALAAVLAFVMATLLATMSRWASRTRRRRQALA